MAGRKYDAQDSAGQTTFGKFIRLAPKLNWRHAHGILWPAYLVLGTYHMLATAIPVFPPPPCLATVGLCTAAVGSMFTPFFRKKLFKKPGETITECVYGNPTSWFFLRGGLYSVGFQAAAASHESSAYGMLAMCAFVLVFCFAVLEQYKRKVLFDSWFVAQLQAAQVALHPQVLLMCGWAPSAETRFAYQTFIYTLSALVTAVDVFIRGVFCSNKMSRSDSGSLTKQMWIIYACVLVLAAGIFFGRNMAIFQACSILGISGSIKVFKLKVKVVEPWRPRSRVQDTVCEGVCPVSGKCRMPCAAYPPCLLLGTGKGILPEMAPMKANVMTEGALAPAIVNRCELKKGVAPQVISALAGTGTGETRNNGNNALQAMMGKD